ncbi:hypothetical protein [uncultured Sphingomonas sp.]|uniref:hypothetical protein n=1 Tax=uncultured Sphingomonas sp. TaxID=158754 RepID=UPI0025D8F5A1|nr:hypothetical protein [uncultured Sphingomonas sp.]
MDALVPAFVAALLAGIGERPARLAALLGERRGVFAGFALGHAAAIAIAIAGAILIAPMLSTNARSILLAIALILAGFGTVWQRRIERPSGPAPVAAAAGSFAGGEGTAFLAFALAIGGSLPVLAGVGAFAGAMLLVGIAGGMGQAWFRLPLRTIGRIAGGLLLVTGIIVGLGGLRLI